MHRKTQNENANKLLKYKYKYFQLKQLHQAQALTASQEAILDGGAGEERRTQHVEPQNDNYIVRYMVKPCDGGKSKNMIRLKVVDNGLENAQKTQALLEHYMQHWETDPVLVSMHELSFDQCIIAHVAPPEKVIPGKMDHNDYDPITTTPHPAALDPVALVTSVHEQITAQEGEEKEVKSLVIEKEGEKKTVQKETIVPTEFVKPETVSSETPAQITKESVPVKEAKETFLSPNKDEKDKKPKTMDMEEIERRAKEMVFAEPTRANAIGGRRIVKVRGGFKNQYGNNAPISGIKIDDKIKTESQDIETDKEVNKETEKEPEKEVNKETEKETENTDNISIPDTVSLESTN